MGSHRLAQDASRVRGAWLPELRVLCKRGPSQDTAAGYSPGARQNMNPGGCKPAIASASDHVSVLCPARGLCLGSRRDVTVSAARA